MSRVTLDATLLTKLQNAEETLEICDLLGRTLGYFHPVAAADDPTAARSPFSDQELQGRRKDRTGRPLADILKDLGTP